MKRKKQIGMGVITMASVVLLMALTSTSPQPVTPRATPAADQVTVAVQYVVREWNGQLAVFRKGSTHPEMVYEDVAVTTLPAAEQERLRKGIDVNDRSALTRLLEDYTS